MKPGLDSDRVLLEHIRECVERIREYTAGGDRATFYASRLVQDAVSVHIEEIAAGAPSLARTAPAPRPSRAPLSRL